MKKTLAPTLALTLLVLGMAGIAWAGPAAVRAPQEPVAETPAPDQAAEASLPAEEGELDEITLEGLFQEPVEVGACCKANCMDQWSTCMFGCGGDSICNAQCREEKEACEAQC